MKFAVTGTDGRFALLRELLLADGHSLCAPCDADCVVPPPWDAGALYAQSESYQVLNAALTAEAAEALLQAELPLHGARGLVLGFGRLGKLCARRLRDAGARITVAARSGEARSWARALGYGAVSTELPEAVLRECALIVNTVPAPVLTGEQLAALPEDALLLELASSPGGIDSAAARERGLRYIRAPGLPGKYAPDRAALLLRDALYEVLRQPRRRLGVALTGSHCTFDKTLLALEGLRGLYTLVPILSQAAAETDTMFGPAAEYRARLETLCGRAAVTDVAGAEPFGAREPLELLLVAPCTGNTLAKLARGVTDGPVTMACKAHLRNGRPLLLAIATNDGLSGSAENIGALLQRKNVFFVPFRQDAPAGKPYSLAADLSLLGESVAAALEYRQLQPILC